MKMIWVIFWVAILAVAGFILYPIVASSVSPSDMTKNTEVALGDMMAFLKQYDQALMFYDMALQISPDDPVILKKKGEILYKSGKKAEAMQVFNRILDLDRNNTAALTRQGDLLVQQGDLNGALAYYEKAIAADPTDSKVLLRKGDVLLTISMLEQQKLHGVAQNLSKPLGTVNYQPVPAEQLQSTESYRQVIDSYQKAMQLDPTLSIVVSARMLAATQNQMLNYEQLLKDMQASP